MPVFVKDPSQFSKSRLKSDLIAHNVALPPAESKKEVYVELYLKHIDHKNAADFSSDEEDQLQEVIEEEKEEDPEMLEPSGLTDDDLKAMLLKHGVKAGPIVASTRALYEKKLKKLLQAGVQPVLNGAGDVGQYSDSEEEEENDKESGSEQAAEEITSHVDQDQQESSQVQFEGTGGGATGRKTLQWVRKALGHWEPSPTRHAGNVAETSSNWSQQAPSLLTPKELCRTSTVNQRNGIAAMESRSSLSSGAGRESGRNGSYVQEHWSRFHRDTQMMDRYTMTNQSLNDMPMAFHYNLQIKEPVADVLKEMFPDATPTLTGISASRRRPIKGAAGRPIKYKYPDTPVSPMTLERRELERRLVPLSVQVVVFLIVACLLYLIYAYVEDSSSNPFEALLDNLSLESDREEGLWVQPETQDTPVLDPPSGQD